ncbi:MAG: exo-alpha-sialidase, partial [Opitutaceae bacterium]|nr:exo-alpha-sialidase [Opitutaceae bacterium]
MFYMSKKLCALFVVMLASAGLHAGLVTKTWSEAPEKDRWRPRVLLISGELTGADAGKLGAALADQAIVCQLQSPSVDAAEVLRQLAEAKAGDWELVYVDCKGDEASVTALATRLHEITMVAVWRNPQSMPLLTAALKELDGVFTADYTVISDRKLDGAIPAYPLGKNLAGSLAGILRAALLAKSAPWASLPQGARDLSWLTNQQKALENPGDLPRANGTRSTVYRAREGEWQFNMHPFIAWHDGLFFAIWSCGRVNEDSSSQHLRYATSADGLNWSEAKILAADPDGEKGRFQWMAGGLHVRDGKLYAYGTLHKGGQQKEGIAWKDAAAHQFRWTGKKWRDEGVIMDDTLVYFAPMPIGDGEFAIRRSSDMWIYAASTLFGKNQWKSAALPGYLLRHYRMSETSHYTGNDGELHLIIRDQAKTKRLYHSVSFDRGGTWTIPVQTNYPDAVSKNLSGRLSNGWFYLVNTPVTRKELVMSFSRDGWTFGNAVLLRDNAPALRYKGGAKNRFSYNYSHAV